MPHLAQILRARRKRRERIHRQRRWGSLGLLAAGALTVLGGVVAVALALTFRSLTGALPPVDDLERIFGASGREAFRPVRFYDRTGGQLLFEYTNPLAENRRWIYLDPDGPIDLPAYTLQALLQALDQDFWTHPGYHRADAVGAITGYLFAVASPAGPPTITERLASAQLAPLAQNVSPAAGRVQSILLAAEMSRRYPREQILEWFVNSADFGRGAFGIDAAALTYFGKHAADLTLAESALLAPLPLDPSVNPLDQPLAAAAAQRALLAAMERAGTIKEAQGREAARESVQVRTADPRTPGPLDSFESYVITGMQAAFGRAALGRSGLRVQTTLDLDLQQQAACTLESQLARLAGGEAGTTVAAGDGSGCLAAGLLSPLRPKDAGVDHAVSGGALIVLDAGSGEILGLIGAVDEPRPVDSMLNPFTALTAFSQGYSPASMLVDVVGEAAVPAGRQQHGPVRLRTALANNYGAALGQLQERVGVESVARTLGSLGLGRAAADFGAGQEPQAGLLELGYAFSVFASEGTLHGVVPPGGEGQGKPQPIVILQIEDATRRLVYQARPATSALVSAQLAYLMVDILSDEPARWPSLGRGNPLELGRPAGALSGVSTSGTAWTVGFTPQLLVGVRIDADPSRAEAGLTALNGSAPVWHAVLQYATRGQPGASWRVPPGMSTLEVCDPSGLLPTVYCPSVVRETFIDGTEPTTFDNLFQPYLVNRETGKLATLDTPPELVEERVFMTVPPEAAGWAQAAGIAQPPQEYDTLQAAASGDEHARISSPEPFEFLRGTARVLGYADPPELGSFRLQYGRGLNPTQWVQVGADETRPVRGGLLGTWDTQAVNGLYTLQLIIVESSGRLRTASVPVTIDNQPPTAVIELPLEGQVIEAGPGDEIVLQAGVDDEYGVAELTFYIDGQAVATLTQAPWSTRWEATSIGTHEISIRAIDSAGNRTLTDPFGFEIALP